MELKIKPHNGLPCSLEIFEINDIEADETNFGEMVNGESDCEAEGCEICDYGCHNKYFEPFSVKTVKANLVKTKLNTLSDKEIEKILDELETQLYVGDCGWCV